MAAWALYSESHPKKIHTHPAVLENRSLNLFPSN